MRGYLRKLDFEFDDGELDSLIQSLAGAQDQRFAADESRSEAITRSTAIVVLAELAPQITQLLQEAGLDWKGFREEIGLTGGLTPKEVDDVDLHVDFQTALTRFAERHPDRRRPTPVNLATAIVEMVRQDPGPGELGKRFKDFGLDPASLPKEFPESSPRRVAWICQFRPDTPGEDLLRERGSGQKVIWWWPTHQHRNTMHEGDPVVYLRQIGVDEDRGGVVGTGHVLSSEPVQTTFLRGEESPVIGDGLATEIIEAFVDDPIARDEAFTDPPFPADKIWRGSIVDLTEAQALRISDVLIENGRKRLFGRPPGPDQAESRTRFIPDDPELDQDLLNRGPLAISLGRYIHRIWLRTNNVQPVLVGPTSLEDEEEKENGQAVYDSVDWTGRRATERVGPNYAEDRRASRAGFVIHLDAPWGGGKTTFANFIARVLNPLAYATGDRSFLRGELGEGGAPAPVFLADVDDREELASWPDDARRPWIVVTFNAWQNEHIDPPWWAFYQSIRRQCFATLRREGWEAFDADGRRRGPGTNPRRLMRVAWLWLWEVGWRLGSPKIRLLLGTSLLSGLLVLGFLALRVLVGGNEGEIVLNLGTTTGAVIAGVTGVGSFLWSMASVFTESILPGTSSFNERLSLGSGDPYERFRHHFYSLCWRLRRPILVVVDDLDRCRPGFVVGLVRGLQTILRSPRLVYLILGDRDWIERAFESEHQEMSAIDVGDEQSFGARFVEKAIPISLMLPDTSPEQKTDYVEAVLFGDQAEQRREANGPDVSGTAHAESAAVEKRAREIVREMDLSDIVTAQAAISERLNREFEIKRENNGGPTGDSSLLARQIQHFTAAEVVKKAGRSEAVSREVAHRLAPLTSALPPNPRQIKRIINAITIYQLFATISGVIGGREGQEPTPLTRDRWQQLVLWVVLMTEWPRTWRLLASHPWLANLLHTNKSQWKKADAAAKDRLSGNASATISHIQRIREDPRVMAVLDNRDFDKNGPVRIDEEAVAWLRQLTPVFRSDVSEEKGERSED